MKTRLLAATALSLLALTGAACSPQPPTQSSDAKDSDTLVVYTSRKEEFVAPLLEKFTKDTGIKVDALYADDAVVNRLKEEAPSPRADIMIGNDAGALEYLRLQNVLAAPAAAPAGLDSIDSTYRASDGTWFGLSARTRAFIYNKDLITEAEMPKSVYDLTDEKRKGRFAITRGGNGSMIAHVSALRAQWGDAKTEQWIRSIKENAGAITEGHGDIRKAVGAGEFSFGLVNNYYFHQQLREPKDNNVGIIYPDQAEGEMGAVVNAAGVGFVAGGPNPVSALKFAEWVLLPENQRAFSAASLEVPLNADLEAPEGAAAISSYKVNDMPLNSLGAVWEDTRSLIERAGLDLELK
jgi:iron(III) transport system substrate-binding protein